MQAGKSIVFLKNTILKNIVLPCLVLSGGNQEYININTNNYISNVKALGNT